MRTCLFTFIMMWSSLSQAFFTDADVFYISDSLSAASDTSISRSFLDFSFGMDLTRSGDIVIGWSITSLSTTDSTSTEVTYSTFDMGPKIGYYINKSRSWSAFLTYNLQATATYNSGSTESKWRGTSIKFETAYAPEISEGFYAGIKFNYYSASLVEQFDASDNYSEVSYSRGIMWPSIYLSYRP